jgi:hypothetical protein
MAVSPDAAKPLDMNYVAHLELLFQLWELDNRITPNHRAIYLELFRIWNKGHWVPVIQFHRDDILKRCHVRRSTYVQCMKDLHAWSYIDYQPNNSPRIGNFVKLFERPAIAVEQDLSDSALENLNSIPESIQLNSDLTQNALGCHTVETRLPDGRDSAATQPTLGCQTVESESTRLPYSQDSAATRSRLGCTAADYIIYKQTNNINYERKEENNLAYIEQKKIVLSDDKLEKSLPPYATATPVEPVVKSAAAQPFANGFCPPSLEKTQEAFAAKNFPLEEAEKFFHYYAAKGWTVGSGAPMSNLDSAIHNWMIKSRQFKQNRSHNPNPKRHDYLHDANDRNKDYSIPL